MPNQSEPIAAADLARFIVEKTHHNLLLTGKAGTNMTVFLKVNDIGRCSSSLTNTI